MASFLNGAAAMACLAISVFFVKYWHESMDSLFVWLCGAFGAFTISYCILGLLPHEDDRRSYAFAVRLLGFIGVVVGLAVKERQSARRLGSVTSKRR